MSIATFNDHRRTGTLAAASDAVTLNHPGLATATVQLVGSPTMTVVFEVNDDEGASPTWVGVSAINVNTGAVSSTATAAGIYRVDISGYRLFRVRCSAFTSGSFAVTVNGSNAQSPTSTFLAGGGGSATVTYADANGTASPAVTEQRVAADLNILSATDNVVNRWRSAKDLYNLGVGVGGGAIAGVGCGGWDASVWRPILLDTSGRQMVVGPVAIGAAATGTNPIFCGAADAAQNLQQMRCYGSVTDNTSAAVQGLFTNSELLMYNGVGFDKVRNNTEVTLLNSAARTTTQTSSDITTYNLSAIQIILDVTTPGTGSITVSIDGKDPASGKYYNLLTGSAVTTAVTNVYTVDPNVPAVANVTAQKRLPRTFRIVVTHNNANSITYSVGYVLQLCS